MKRLAIPLCCLLLLGCGDKDADRPPAKPPGGPAGDTLTDAKKPQDPAKPYAPEKIDEPTLPNLYKLHEQVYSGGQPQGEPAFAALAKLGVKTVISVDGATPDLASATKHGLKYVHLPHGYDGVPAERGKELAKAVRELPGPLYIHCHHGKHRSPAAATVACIETGLLDPKHGLSVLTAAGTSKDYRGLYKSVEAARRVADEELAAIIAEFPETARLPPMAEAMVAIEHTHDHLKLLSANKWETPADHPALYGSHEALLLKEHYHELLRTTAVQREPEKFQQLLRDGEMASDELETALRNVAKDRTALAEADRAFAAVSATCKTCHREFRDVPLDEKHKP